MFLRNSQHWNCDLFLDYWIVSLTYTYFFCWCLDNNKQDALFGNEFQRRSPAWLGSSNKEEAYDEQIFWVNLNSKNIFVKLLIWDSFFSCRSWGWYLTYSRSRSYHWELRYECLIKFFNNRFDQLKRIRIYIWKVWI